MGIPHLTSFLQPYAPFTALSGQNLVIDGPGFAYHISHICSSHIFDERNSFDAAPSYEELGAVSIAWLEELQHRGNTIAKIFFDGLLPPTKLDTRLERLSTQTRKLASYYKSCLNPPRAQSKMRVDEFPPQFPRTSVHRGMPLPPPAFLVPAILEALGESHQFKAVTQVVPGEADTYCAGYVKQCGGIVLTGDSDLLLHDLGPEGAVCFFKDMEPALDESSTIRFRNYRPTAIAQALFLPAPDGLLSLGFELSLDLHCTLLQAIGRASLSQAATKFEAQYAEFKRCYSSSQAESVDEHPASPDEMSRKTLLNIRSLDPRISEYILQFPHFLNLAQKGLEIASLENVNVFLPVLFDCPAHTSAWEISAGIRLPAYGLINLLVPEKQQCFAVHEHRARQSTISGKVLRLPEISAVGNDCLDIASMLSQIKDQYPKASSELLWVAVATNLDIATSLSLGKPAITRIVQEQLGKTTKSPETFKTYSWEVIHSHAQVHGVLYSLRILKSIMKLVLSFPRIGQLSHGFLMLFRELDTLPKLADFPNVQDTISWIHSISVRTVDTVGTNSAKVKAPKTMSKIRKPTNPGKEKRQTNTANRFHALSID